MELPFKALYVTVFLLIIKTANRTAFHVVEESNITIARSCIETVFSTSTLCFSCNINLMVNRCYRGRNSASSACSISPNISCTIWIFKLVTSTANSSTYCNTFRTGRINVALSKLRIKANSSSVAPRCFTLVICLILINICSLLCLLNI